MPGIPKGNQRELLRKGILPEDAGFGAEVEIPAFIADMSDEKHETSSELAPELVALGMPPADAAGIQKWNYQVLSTMAALELRNKNITPEERLRRVAKLTASAAKHYPEAAKYDLDQRIRNDTEAMTTRKRAKAAAQLERRGPAGGAKVIPIRAPGS